ncbi:MAG: SH3 domain-containing protein, partial [Benjaminiella poitrasii]
FVQALHDYLPSSVSPDEAVSCLFFKKGAIIEVFNRDDSGWWDGQCGNVRGWFPSNYV